MGVERRQLEVRPSQIQVTFCAQDAVVLSTLEETFANLSAQVPQSQERNSKIADKIWLSYAPGNPDLMLDFTSGTIQEIDVLVKPNGQLVTVPRENGFRFWNGYFKDKPGTVNNCLLFVKAEVEAMHWHAATEEKEKRAGRTVPLH